MPTDPLPEIQAQWAKQMPELDTSTMLIIGRLQRVLKIMTSEMNNTFKQFDLTDAGFDVMVTLLRVGPPHALSPGELLAQMLITSGTMTNRIDYLVKKGLVVRVNSKQDKRSVKVQLTKDGLALINAAVLAHVETQKRLLSMYSEKEQHKLAELLSAYLRRV